MSLSPEEHQGRGRDEAPGRCLVCPSCHYQTDRKNNLKRHIQTMHEPPTVELECCGETFSSKADMRDHTRARHRHGYHCTECNHTFCRKALLKRHLSVHTGIKEFSCNACTYETSHKSNLERHMRVHMKQNEMLPRPPERSSSEMQPPRLDSAQVLYGDLMSQHPAITWQDHQSRPHMHPWTSNAASYQWCWPLAFPVQQQHPLAAFLPPGPLLPGRGPLFQPRHPPAPPRGVKRGFTVEALLKADSTDQRSSQEPSTSVFSQGWTGGIEAGPSHQYYYTSPEEVLRPTPLRPWPLDLSMSSVVNTFSAPGLPPHHTIASPPHHAIATTSQDVKPPHPHHTAALPNQTATFHQYTVAISHHSTAAPPHIITPNLAGVPPLPADASPHGSHSDPSPCQSPAGCREHKDSCGSSGYGSPEMLGSPDGPEEHLDEEYVHKKLRISKKIQTEMIVKIENQEPSRN